MSFKKYRSDLLEISIGSVYVYTQWVCEIEKRSKSNCIFENQKIEIIYKIYSSLNTWVTLMKQKINNSPHVEEEHAFLRYVKNSELTKEIRCHSDWIFSRLHQAPPPPLSNYVLFLAIYQCLGVFQDVVVKFWHVCNHRLPFHVELLVAPAPRHTRHFQLRVHLGCVIGL